MNAQAIRGITGAASTLFRHLRVLGLLAALAGALPWTGAQAASMTVLHIFTGGEGWNAQGVAFGSDGNLYGSTYSGDSGAPQIGPSVPVYEGPGTIYKLSTSGTFTDLKTFNTVPLLSLIGNNSTLEGTNPGALVSNGKGLFYGYDFGPFGQNTTGYALFLFSPLVPYTVVPAYVFNLVGGSEPSGLVIGKDGTRYGTSVRAAETTNTVSGTVFKLNVLNLLTTLHTFTVDLATYAGDCFPGGLTLGSDGNLYGVLHFCNKVPSTVPYAAGGIIYKLSTSGTYTVLHVFSGPEGVDPGDVLVQGSDGNFYGTATGDVIHNSGTSFKLSPQGGFTLLHQFQSATDGAGPNSLMLAADGNFYGTTSSGGSADFGSVFRMTPAGEVTSIYQFSSFSSISYPNSALVQGSDGSFYGTSCGPQCGYGGGVYKITLP